MFQEKMLSNDIDVGDYEAWLNHYLIMNCSHFEPMAVELMMSIPDKSVGGQLDLLGYDTKLNRSD